MDSVPPSLMANVFPFHRAATGAKFPDDDTTPSFTLNAKLQLNVGQDSTFGVSATAFRYHPAATHVFASTAGGSSWTWPARSTAAGTVDNYSVIAGNCNLTRTVGYGLRVECPLSYSNVSGYLHVCVIPDPLEGTTWSYPTTVGMMEYFTDSYTKIPLADVIQDPQLITSKFYGKNAMEYRDINYPDYDTTVVTNTRTSSGWSTIIVAVTGANVSATPQISVEATYHLECLPRTSGGTTNLPITTSTSFSQPKAMAALANVAPATPTVTAVSASTQTGIIATISQAWDLGKKIAGDVAPYAEDIIEFLEGAL